MEKKLYGIFVDEGVAERLIWKSVHSLDFIRPDTTRRFFYGGVAIMPLIFNNANSAHTFVKSNKVMDDFKESSQYYVRKIKIVPWTE